MFHSNEIHLVPWHHENSDNITTPTAEMTYIANYEGVVIKYRASVKSLYCQLWAFNHHRYFNDATLHEEESGTSLSFFKYVGVFITDLLFEIEDHIMECVDVNLFHVGYLF